MAGEIISGFRPKHAVGLAIGTILIGVPTSSFLMDLREMGDYPIFPRDDRAPVIIDRDPKKLETEVENLAARICPQTDPKEFAVWVQDNAIAIERPSGEQAYYLVMPVCD